MAEGTHFKAMLHQHHTLILLNVFWVWRNHLKSDYPDDVTVMSLRFHMANLDFEFSISEWRFEVSTGKGKGQDNGIELHWDWDLQGPVSTMDCI